MAFGIQRDDAIADPTSGGLAEEAAACQWNTKVESDLFYLEAVDGGCNVSSCDGEEDAAVGVVRHVPNAGKKDGHVASHAKGADEVFGPDFAVQDFAVEEKFLEKTCVFQPCVVFP